MGAIHRHISVGKIVNTLRVIEADRPDRIAPDLHERTTQAIARMLAQDPAERYESYEEVIQDLTEAQEELKAGGATKAIIAPTGKRPSILTLLGLLATLVVGVAVAWFMWKNRVMIFH